MNIAEKLFAVADNEMEVYKAGIRKENQHFWDAFLDYGARKQYSYAFYNWQDERFYPLYDIVPTAATNMFQGCDVGDLKQRLSDCGVVLDFKNCTTANYCFASSKVTKIPLVDFSSIQSTSNSQYVFFNCTKLEEIEKIIVNPNMTLISWFSNCEKLKEVRFEGEIARSVSFSVSPLSKESIESVISALSDNTSGVTLTLKQSAVDNAFTEDEWNTLISAKTNWTFSLV